MEGSECNSNPHTAAVLNTDVSNSKKASILDEQDQYAQQALMLDPRPDGLLAFNMAGDKKKAPRDDNYTFRSPEEFEGELEEVHNVVREVTLLVEAASGLARSHDARSTQFSDARGLGNRTLNPIRKDGDPNEASDKKHPSESGPDNCRGTATRDYSDRRGTLEKVDGTSKYKAEWRQIASKKEDVPAYEMQPPKVRSQASSHQQDNSWTEKESKRWARIKANMARNGLDKSPFAPRSFQEYIELKLQTTRSAADVTTKQLLQLRGHLTAGRPFNQLTGTLATPKCSLGLAKNPSGLSPVLCRPTIWTDAAYCHGNTNWASRTELNEAGDMITMEGCSRFFPVPRMNKPGDQFSQMALYEHEVKELDELTQELELSEINYQTRELIKHIRNMD